MSTKTKLYPSFANKSVNSFPNPDAAPVINAVLIIFRF